MVIDASSPNLSELSVFYIYVCIFLFTHVSGSFLTIIVCHKRYYLKVKKNAKGNERGLSAKFARCHLSRIVFPKAVHREN